MIINIFNLFSFFSQHISYVGVFVLMIIESSFLPMPSEIVVPPAAFVASQGGLSIGLVVLVALFGSLIGALINYYIGFYLGRSLVYRLASYSWAKYLFITPEKIEKAEKYFLKDANSATFIGRLIPVVRQLVSLPAGFSKMNIFSFLLWTTLGSGLWIIILAALGYFIGANQELLHQYYKEISVVLLGVVVLYLLVRIIMKKRK